MSDRFIVPLSKLTLGLWLRLCPVGVAASFSFVFMQKDEDGEEAEDPPTLLDLFLKAELCLSVALAAALKA